ncbi:xylulose kinase, partial [Acidimicrobiaceae bacterium USS-CC1]|nr:xylulose kinase [Acidiferrimicrobium australe]
MRAGQLPGVRMFGEAIGRVGDAILGAGSVDAFCEQLVAGPLAEGDALVVLGSTLVVWSARPTAAEAPGLWNAPQLDGGWFVGGASNAGGLWLSWVERSLAPGSPLDAHPRRVPVWLPYIRGERVPRHQPERRASLADVDLLQGPAELRRAALEASAFVVRSLLERAGPLPRRILATGGGSTARPW